MTALVRWIACLLLGLAPQLGLALDEIRIGASAALSGPAAGLGQRFHAGAKAGLRQFNAQGGLNGRPLRLQLLDDAYEADRAEANTRKLAEDPTVLALFGYVGTPTSRMALPYVRRHGIPLVAAYTGASVLREPHNPLVFNVRASYVEEARQLATAMKLEGVRSLNVVYQADLFGRAGLEAIREAAQAQGIQVLASDTIRRNSAEVARATLTLVRQQPADAIFIVSSYASTIAFVQSAREAGFEGRFYALSFAGLEHLQKALAKLPRGRLTIAQVVPNALDRILPLVADYQQAMIEAGDRQFDSISLEGYMAARVLVEGLRRAKPPLSRDSLVAGLDAIGDLDLGGFKLRLRAGQHEGSSWVGLRTLP